MQTLNCKHRGRRRREGSKGKREKKRDLFYTREVNYIWVAVPIHHVSNWGGSPLLRRRSTTAISHGGDQKRERKLFNILHPPSLHIEGENASRAATVGTSRY